MPRRLSQPCERRALDPERLRCLCSQDSSASKVILQEEADSSKDAALKELLPFGFAIHHAGMQRADRSMVEDLFADGHVQVRLPGVGSVVWVVLLSAYTTHCP